MPYKNYQNHLEYMRNYHQQHKKERNQKSKDYYRTHKAERRLYDEQYVKTHREERKLYNRKWRKEVKDFLIQKYGKICIVCGKEPKHSYLVFHEKNFKPHNHITSNQIKNIWQNFVPLCRNCHRTLHHFKLYRENFEKLI